MRTARYRAVPSKSIVGGQLREKKGRRRRRGKEERRRRGEEERSTSRRPGPCTVAARGSLASHRHPRPRVAREPSPPLPASDFPPAYGDRLLARGERSRRSPSETLVFNENSPSGNDYLSEVTILLWCRHVHAFAFETTGIINGTAPNPVRLSEMCEQLGQVVGRPSWLPVPEFALKAVLGEGASVVRIHTLSFCVLEGQRVLPLKAKELGFSYKYPYVKDAIEAIMREP
ncbi:hypothetical protein GW17_00012549 [Ensete ventricosum]|nr:hypothetical protein GW17_00012549 [Ensete ventricosum]